MSVSLHVKLLIKPLSPLSRPSAPYVCTSLKLLSEEITIISSHYDKIPHANRKCYPMGEVRRTMWKQLQHVIYLCHLLNKMNWKLHVFRTTSQCRGIYMKWSFLLNLLGPDGRSGFSWTKYTGTMGLLPTILFFIIN